MKRLSLSFYARPAEELARELVGKIIARTIDGQRFRARIVETEAYVGPSDLACHSSHGRTARTEVMFGPPGHAYVYLIYGLHQMLNITAGGAQAVLLRAAEPLDGWQANLTGPGRLARALQITRAQNGLALNGAALLIADDGARPAIAASPRIGIDYALHWKDAPLRFYDLNSRAVSKG